MLRIPIIHFLLILLQIAGYSPLAATDVEKNEGAIEMKDTRILISGAGIAGLTAAYWLKQRGYSPTIVEKHPYLREGGYKVDVRGTALKVAKRMGIYQDLIDKNVNIERSKLVTPNLSVFEFESDLLGYVVEGDIEINRWDLSQILSKAVGEIEIIYDDSITKIDEMVHFEKMEPRKFDLIIGADGLHSNVRRLAFGEDSKFLKKYGIHFCIFPISNTFDLERSEIVYFDKGKFAAAYAANNHSYACLAFKSDEEILPSKNLKAVFEKQCSDLAGDVPLLISQMNKSSDCYFNSSTQVKMPSWSKGRVALIGDAAHAVSAMGTSLSMVGGYVLAREIEESNGDYSLAFDKYEKSMRNFVEDAQDLAESLQQFLGDDGSSMWVTFQLYLMKIFPKRFIQYLTNKGRVQMKKVSNALTI